MQINWYFHVLFMLFFFGLGSVLFWRMRRERLGWKKTADKHRLFFHEKGGRRHEDYLKRFRLLGNSVVDDPTQMLSGQLWDQEVLMFNWFFQSSGTLDSVRGGFACTLLPRPQETTRLMAFHISMGNFVPRSGESLMVLDDEAFTENYRILCNNRKQADQMLSQATRDFLLKEPYWVEQDADMILIAWQGAWEPANFEEGLRKVETLLNQLKG